MEGVGPERIFPKIDVISAHTVCANRDMSPLVPDPPPLSPVPGCLRRDVQ